MSINYPTLSAVADLAHFRHFSHFRHSLNYNIFQIHLFMQNKAIFGNDKMNIITIVTMSYVNLGHWLRPKNKAKTNPI